MAFDESSNFVYDSFMSTLHVDPSQIGFVEREKKNGEHVSNKCGRDFLYFALNFYDPEKFNPQNLNPIEIDTRGFFGVPMPAQFAWTQLQFAKAPEFLKANGCSLIINDVLVQSYLDFVKAILFSRKQLHLALAEVENAIDNNIPCGIDISLGLKGLLDHVVFVYGYDEKYFYIVDTHDVSKLQYEQLDSAYPFLFKLSRQVIQDRWTIFGRVWKVIKSQ